MRGAARCGAARRIGSAGHSGRMPSMSSLSRSPPRSRRANGPRTSCSASCAEPIRTGICAREEFDECVRMLAEGFSTRRGRRARCCITTAVNKMLRPRKGARLTAITSGGAIPDNADYKVMLEPEGSSASAPSTRTLPSRACRAMCSSWAIPSYRILRVERGTVRVEDAHGQPPSIPFWLGEAPGRTEELSAAVSRLEGNGAALRRRVVERSAAGAAMPWLIEYGRARRGGGVAGGAIPGRRPRGAWAACRPSTPWCSSASSTNPAACSSSFIPPSAAA